MIVATTSFLAAPYVVLMPLFAKEIFGGDARLFGLLVGCAGGGSLLGSLYLAGRQGTDGLARLVGVAAPATGAAVALFALSPGIWMAMPVLVGLGLVLIVTVAGSNTLIQTQVSNDFRGRVMALFTMAFLGIAPLGSFSVGSLAHAFGVRPTLVACGLLTIAAGLAYRRRVT